MIEKLPQISLLKKEIGEEIVCAEIVRLIISLTQFVPYKGAGAPFASWAKMIVKEFWWLRVEELAHIFSQGLNGNYNREGKIYGELTYSFISEWIHLYDEHEREMKIVEKRVADNSALNSTKDVTLSKEEMYLNSVYTGKVEKEKRKAIPQDDIKLEAFIVFKEDYSLEQLYEALKDAKTNNWLKTAEAIEGEINQRTN